MTETPGLIWALLFFMLAIAPLIFIHELGHYLVGRWCGIKADVFSIGFGKPLFGWTDSHGTRWQVGWMPLGGYVKFAGDMSAASAPTDAWLSMPADDRNRTFQSKPVWARAVTVFAGPAVNFLFALVVLSGVFLAVGEPRTPPIVFAVQPGSAAEAAGLKRGDRVVALGSTAIDRFEDIGQIVALHAGEPITTVIDRDGQRGTITVTPRAQVLRDRFGNESKQGVLGIASGKRVLARITPIETVGASAHFIGGAVQGMADALGQLVTGRRPVSDFKGPVGMAQLSGQVATLGVPDFLLFMAMISINLGFINLLPIPMLDGGHLFFYAVEAIRRKPVPVRAQEWAYRSGLAVLLGFMVMVTINDVAGLGLWSRLAGLIG